jgi:hypothetical protein
MEIVCAMHDRKVICCFPTREECKTHIMEKYPNLDPFDVIIETKYLYDYKQTTDYFDR